MRVQVNISDDLVAQLDTYAKAVGMSRSGLCAYFVGQGMFGITKGLEMASEALDGVMPVLLGAKGDIPVERKRIARDMDTD